MSGGINRSWRRSVLCGLLGMAAPWGASAQEQEQQAAAPEVAAPAPDVGGVRSTFTTSIGVEGGRNLDLDPGADDQSGRLTGLFGYAYERQTRQTLLSFNAAINPVKDDDNGTGLYPTLGLGWQYDASRTRFTFSANYGEAKVTDQSLGFDAETGQIIEYDGSGTRILKQLAAGVEGGIDMPLGYTLQLNRSEIDYRDLSAGADYAPSTFTGGKLGLRGDVSPMTQLNLSLGHSRYSSENRDHTTRKTDTASLGVTQRIDALTSVTASVGRERIETERRITGDKSESGGIFGLGVTREDPLGAYALAFGQNVTENGTRNEITLGRDRKSKLGSFSGMIGASRGEEGGTDWIGSLAYATELPRDRLSVSFTRSVQTDDDGEDVVVTRASGGISHILSPVNSLDFGLTASATSYPDKDTTRVDTSLAYRHLLAQDISLQAGVRLGLAQESGEEDAESQSLFLTLTRQFDFRH